jgi:hypothetical protein
VSAQFSFHRSTSCAGCSNARLLPLTDAFIKSLSRQLGKRKLVATWQWDANWEPVHGAWTELPKEFKTHAKKVVLLALTL